MELLRTRKALAAWPLALALVLPAAQAAALRIASAFDPQTMDPHSLALQYHTRVDFQIYESLVGRDQNYRLVPVLATAWAQTDPLTWRFKLRPDVHFHDGSLFTAEDAVFSFERALAPPSQRQFVLKGVKRVRMVDPLTIDFELAAPDASLPQKLVLVAMMSKRWAQAHHVERAQDYNARQETFAVRNANGTGAYQLDRYEPDIRTTLKAFPQWWNRGAADNGNVDAVSFVTIRSDATRLAALHSGEVDVVLDPPYQDVEQLRHDPAVAVTQVGDIATDYLAFDQASASLPGVAPGPDGKPRNPFKDLRVRRAVYQAINIDLVIQKVLKGLATATGDLLAPEFGAPVEAAGPRLRYDPVHARELLREAGYPEGFDLSMDCVNVAFREHVCQAIAAMLTQVGIRTTLHTSPGTQFFPMITPGQDQPGRVRLHRHLRGRLAEPERPAAHLGRQRRGHVQRRTLLQPAAGRADRRRAHRARRRQAPHAQLGDAEKSAGGDAAGRHDPRALDGRALTRDCVGQPDPRAGARADASWREGLRIQV